MSTQDRRTFLATLAAGAGAGIRPPALAPLGVQLYTLRREMRRDVRRTLERVARIGYREVEFAGYHGRPARELRSLLDGLGLAAPAGHVELDDTGSAWDRALDGARAVGHRWVVVAWIDAARRRTLDDWRRTAERFDRAAARAREAGLRFAYHNHDFEFVPVEGHVPYELLLAETDPALVELELDLYWATKAGHDPLALFARHPGRFAMLHVKDSAGPPAHRMTDVGAGTIPFPRILAARERAGVRHLFVEHDEPRDPWSTVEASYRYLSRLAR